MSLLRLLTTGRSLVGLRNGESPYRLSQQRFVPNFGKKPNPFRATTLPEPVRTVALTPQNATTKLQVPTPPAASTAPEGGSGEAALPVAAMAKEPAQSRPIQVSWLKRTWAGMRSRFGRREKPAAPRVARAVKPVVQGELSLEGVQVVRNDLRDSDLEIVPAQEARPTPKPAASTEPGSMSRMPEPILVARSAAGAGRTAFSRMSARLFGVAKT
jgi:hypothetical protein